MFVDTVQVIASFLDKKGPTYQVMDTIELCCSADLVVPRVPSLRNFRENDFGNDPRWLATTTGQAAKRGLTRISDKSFFLISSGMLAWPYFLPLTSSIVSCNRYLPFGQLFGQVHLVGDEVVPQVVGRDLLVGRQQLADHLFVVFIEQVVAACKCVSKP